MKAKEAAEKYIECKSVYGDRVRIPVSGNSEQWEKAEMLDDGKWTPCGDPRAIGFTAKAAEAAKIATLDPAMTPFEVMKLIPEYPNPLHRRQWIHGFLKALPEQLRPRFEDLKK